MKDVTPYNNTQRILIPSKPHEDSAVLRDLPPLMELSPFKAL